MEPYVEPWLRGPLPSVHPLLSPALYAFQHAREDLETHTGQLTDEQIWARPRGLASVGFHLKHIGGSVDRLMTYLQGRQLDVRQMEHLHAEKEPGGTREELLSQIDAAFRAAEETIQRIDPATLGEPREVGRQRLPTTVIGLLTHTAEHTLRHVGQVVTTAKLLKNVSV